ncbi:MAG: hypothetical protein EOP45_01985 [Sphingobacteriaceae bacterium]|nr:MAG: hypothetical protein EOP45_01985 [Sphingobacteriaceae bacterium]
MKLKINPITTAFLAAIMLLSVSSCKVSTNSEDPTPAAGSESASYKLGTLNVTVTDPYNGTSSHNGVISNQVSLPAKDGSQVKINFAGSAPGTYQLKSYSNAYYKSASAVQYNSVRGELKVTSYTSQGIDRTFSGTFNFVAKSVTNPKDSVVITGGVISNCTNDF